MNRIFSKIWNKTLGSWVVASEFAKRNGKQDTITRLTDVPFRIALLLGTAFGCDALSAHALTAAASAAKAQASAVGISTTTGTKNANRNLGGSNILADVQRFLRSNPKTERTESNGMPPLALIKAPDEGPVDAADDHPPMPGPAMAPNAPAIDGSTAFGTDSLAAADESTAYGHSSYAGDANSTALGSNTNASGVGASAIGGSAGAGGDYATAVGYGALATGIRSVALGAGVQATGNSGVAIGGIASLTDPLRYIYDDQGNPLATAASENATAVGASALASGEGSVALGVQAVASGLSSTAIGDSSYAQGKFSTTLGIYSVAQGQSSVAVGAGGAARGNFSTAIGVSSNALGLSAIALGSEASAQSDSSTALGAKAMATGEKSMAIGNSAVTGFGGLDLGPFKLPAIAASNAIALGSESTAYSTNSLAVGGQAKTYGENSMAIGNAATVGEEGFLIFPPTIIANGVALGANSRVMAENSVALGADSSADRKNTISIGAKGKERQITNVAAGTAGTDAVNQTQLLDALSTIGGAAAFDAKGGLTLPNFTILGGTYHSVSDAFGALNGAFDGVRIDILALQNLTAGTVRNGQVAVGGNEAAKVTPDTRALAVGANAVAAGDHGTAVGDDSYAAGPKDTALGAHASVGADGSTAVGANSSIASAATNAVAVGESASVTAASGTAIGQGASATAAGAVALGQGSVADRVNTVSVGAAGNQRQITNVATGTQDSDAANTEQVTQALATAKTYADAGDRVTLNSAKTYTDQKVSGDLRNLRNEVNDQFHTVNRRLDQVGAMGAAMSQMAFSTQGISTPNRLGVGVGGYGSRSALSVGYSRSLSSQSNLTFGGAVSNGGEASAGIGFGLGW